MIKYTFYIHNMLITQKTAIVGGPTLSIQIISIACQLCISLYSTCPSPGGPGGGEVPPQIKNYSSGSISRDYSTSARPFPHSLPGFRRGAFVYYSLSNLKKVIEIFLFIILFFWGIPFFLSFFREIIISPERAPVKVCTYNIFIFYRERITRRSGNAIIYFFRYPVPWIKSCFKKAK